MQETLWDKTNMNLTEIYNAPFPFKYDKRQVDIYPPLISVTRTNNSELYLLGI